MNLSIKDTYVKHSLGRVLLLFVTLFFSFTFLKAEDFTYTFHVDNASPYVKEAVILTLDVNQTNHDIVLLFDFDLQKSKTYTFQRIGIEEIDAYHAAQIRYTYLIYPLQTGKVDLLFSLTQKATSDDSVAYSFSGDRDNVKTLVTKDSHINLPPLRLEVQALPLGTEIVGDFSVDYHVKTLKGKAYEPLPLQVSITGKGYPPVFENLLPIEGNFTRFTEAPHVKSLASIKGTQSTVTYPMALSHEKSFTLVALDIQAFNPKTEKSYTLRIPEQHFHIEDVNQTLLLDKVDRPIVKQSDWSWLQSLLKYLFVFGVGFFSAYIYKEAKTWKKTKKSHPQAALMRKIKQSKDAKALLQVLLSHDVKKFQKEIDALEGLLYGKETKSLRQIKQEVMEKIK